MIWYLAMNCDDDDWCPVGGLIFFAVLAPVAGLVMYINSLCLRPGFNQIDKNDIKRKSMIDLNQYN